MADPVLLSEKAALRVPPGELWSLLADTERLNRAIGLGVVRFTPFPDGRKKGHFAAETRVMARKTAYEEFPFDWVEGRYYNVVRRFPDGPIEQVSGGIRLSPAPEGTDLEIFARVVPRLWLGAFAAKTLLRKKAIVRVLEYAREFERHRLEERDEPPGLPPPGLVNVAQLEARAAELRRAPVRPGHVEALVRHLRTASDLAVVRMRPFERADAWKADRLEVMRLFLHAARARLVDLHWSVLCPSCRVAAGDWTTLSELKTATHCATCEIKFDADLARSVEVRFSANAAVRRAREETYCIGGPANTPGIVAQLRLEPGESRREEMEARPGPLRVRCYQAGGIYTPEVGAEGAGVLRVRAEEGGLRVEGRALRTGPVALEVTNALGREALVVVERDSWKADAATAALVTSLQDFKELFPAEAVAPGEEVGISDLAILFTDLRASTELYGRVGDAKAFTYVQNHFRYLVESVARHRGGLVKTMGDAIMASFSSGRDAVEAAVEMQAGWAAFHREYGGYDGVALKVGVHQGASIAINNKGRLDYFGQTVNVAARVQGWSNGDDVVVSEAVYRDPDVRACLGGLGVKVQETTVMLKGLEGDHTLYRLIPCR